MSRLLLGFIQETGRVNLFLKEILHSALFTPPRKKLIYQQIYEITTQGFLTTALAGFFVGAIMTVQFTMQTAEFGALGYLGGLSTSATFREVGPLLIAFMLSGKVGAFTAAELGTMKVTEQIDAIRCLGANPMQEIIVPRFIGIVISSFFLLGAGLLMSVGGGALVGKFFSGINIEQYVRHIPSVVVLPSILGGLFKCLVFSVLLATICTYQGYHVVGGSKGVGRAVVQTAVITMVGIVLADWVTTLINEGFLIMVRGE